MARLPHFRQTIEPLTPFWAKFGFSLIFHKNLINRFSEKFKIVDFAPKNDSFPHFKHIKTYQEFSLKIQKRYFRPISNPYHYGQLEKNLRNIFRGKFKHVEFKPKNAFTPFWA